jgi:hypothetical protein
MTALEALKAAREFVQELYAIKNDRGYPRFTGKVSDVLTEEMRVARFLMEESNVPEGTESAGHSA